jgi:hypothetical protein
MDRRRSMMFAVGLALVGAGVAAAPAAADSRGLHLVLGAWDFTSGTCLQFDNTGNCLSASVQADGVADSNVAGHGTYHADLLVTIRPGTDCNVVDEHDTFGFASGQLFIRSLHEDCRVHGNRIFTTFEITGGTGALAGARGSGLEFGNAGAPITYNGRLDR